MYTVRLLAGPLTLLVVLTLTLDRSQARLPDLGGKPIPQVDAGGPSATVNSLAFSDDGETLYAAGLDKVVRVWTLQKGHFVPRPVYRVPIGPGNIGAVNAVALSPDGAWLAMAGRAPMRGEVGFKGSGTILSAELASAEQSQDVGVIYVASTANPRGGKVLRGHQGEVRGLAFAPANKGKPPLLVSAATRSDKDKRLRGALRLWDVSAGKMLAELPDLPATPTAPGLGIWYTGAGIGQVRVAVTWPDILDKKEPGRLRIWEPGSEKALPVLKKTDPLTMTCGLLGQDDTTRVLTGGYGPPGRLQIWRLNPGRTPGASVAAEVPFDPIDKDQFLPISLAVVSTGKGERPSHAAVVLRPLSNSDCRLVLVDLNKGQIVADVRLEDSDIPSRPTIAARGRHIAVAATRDHAIRVYAVADLLAGKTRPEVLQGKGLPLRRVAFVDQGRGLWLSEDSKAPALRGGLLFDLQKQEVRANEGPALESDTPALGPWMPTFDKDTGNVTVWQGKKAIAKVHFANSEVTRMALRPPAPDRPGVLAVAYTERDASRTVILLSDPETGKPYRLLVGHLQDVRGLTFSATRPLLASVADDQTVCVWSLADLAKGVGQIEGLLLGDEKGKVVVRRLQSESPAAKVLAKGDVLEKVGVPEGKAKPFEDAAGFVLAVSALEPGKEVEVTVAGKGVVKLPVGRGLDGRRPLFSLFLLRGGKLPEWLGWNPIGPYDCSSPAAETHLVWHVNTGDEVAPVASAKAEAYHKDYYRPRLLSYLVEEADLERALDKWKKDNPPPQPKASLQPIRPDRAQMGEGTFEYLVRHKVPALSVGINEEYPLDEHHVLRWRLVRADGDKLDADRAVLSGTATRAGRGWQVDLSRVVWQRGEYRLRLGLHARDKGPELPSAAETVKLRFQPPAPELSLRRDGKAVRTTEKEPLESKEDKLTVEVVLKTAGEQAEVQFAGYLNGQPHEDVPAAPVDVRSPLVARFNLKQGLNRLVVRAVNKGALAGHKKEEEATAEVWVQYKAPPEPMPGFTDLRLEPVAELKRLDDKGKGKDVWVVSRSMVRLSGKIEAKGILTEAGWSADKTSGAVPLMPKARTAKFAADLKLKAGEIVTVLLRARSERSDEVTMEYPVVFYPPLPTVSVNPLGSPEVVEETITLSGTYQTETDDPFAVRFQVTSAEGEVKSETPVVDPKTSTWKVKLSLSPGSNTVERFVANKWRGEQPMGEALVLTYQRPPKITAYPKEVEAVETNKVQLALTVESPPDRPLTDILVDQKPVRFVAGKPEKRERRWVWPVQLPEVFVHDGDKNLDRVSVQAVNEEGKSPQVVVEVTHKLNPRPPVAHFIRPRDNDTTQQPEYRAIIRVESERPLERVEIRRDDQVLAWSDLKKVEREGKKFVLQEEMRLLLQPGLNGLDLVAVNRDGRSPRASVVISLNEPGVFLEVERIEQLKDDGEVGQVLKPRTTPAGDLIFPEAATSSLVRLVGRVRWTGAPQDRVLNDSSLQVEVTVGDCRQFPVALERRGEGKEANVRRFHVPLVLNGERNRIKIKIPSVVPQERSRDGFILECAKPAKQQRLHLLIIGVDVKESARLKKRVLDSLGVEAGHQPRDKQGEFFKKPPFERCVLYGTLAGEVDAHQVRARFLEINRQIEELQRESGWINDVVLIYYQGEDVEVPEKRERWLKTSYNILYPKAALEKFAIPCHDLPRLPGSRLLLLNVAAHPGQRGARGQWEGGLDGGFLRYACLDATDVRKADSTLLSVLGEAVSEKNRLGEVVARINELLPKQARKFTHQVALDPDQEKREINKSNR